jgi:hypothetical protein
MQSVNSECPKVADFCLLHRTIVTYCHSAALKGKNRPKAAVRRLPRPDTEPPDSGHSLSDQRRLRATMTGRESAGMRIVS